MGDNVRAVDGGDAVASQTASAAGRFSALVAGGVVWKTLGEVGRWIAHGCGAGS